MFEQDYIMRLIHEMIRMALKLLFHLDTESEMQQLIKETKTEESLDDLMKEIDRGNINEAENKLYKMVDEKKTKDNLLLGLGFYAYLNEKDEDYLMEHDFSRREVRGGLESLMSEYGLHGMTDIFMM